MKKQGVSEDDPDFVRYHQLLSDLSRQSQLRKMKAQQQQAQQQQEVLARQRHTQQQQEQQQGANGVNGEIHKGTCGDYLANHHHSRGCNIISSISIGRSDSLSRCTSWYDQ